MKRRSKGPVGSEQYVTEGFENVGFIDPAPWLDDDGNRLWYDAFEAIDKRGDKGPLLEQLRLGREMTPLIQKYLADLLMRYNLKRPRGRRTTPAYDRTEIGKRLHMASDAVRERPKQTDRDAAIKKAASEWAVSEAQLIAHLSGRLGSTRRMDKRRK